MKAKYFYILAYKLETNYKGLSHRQEMWPDNRAIHRRVDQPWSNRRKTYSLRLKINRLPTSTKWSEDQSISTKDIQ